MSIFSSLDEEMKKKKAFGRPAERAVIEKKIAE